MTPEHSEKGSKKAEPAENSTRTGAGDPDGNIPPIRSGNGIDPGPVPRTTTLEEQLRFETLLSRLSAQFVNLPSPEVDRVILNWLEEICRFLGADRGGLHQFSKDGQRLTMTHSYAVPGVHQAPILITSEKFPVYTELVRLGEVIRMDRSPEDVPPGAEAERQYVLEEGSKSMITVPLRVGRRILGAMVFGMIREERVWYHDVVQRLKLIGEVFANALMRKRFEEDLWESRERFRKAFEHTAVGMAITDPRSRIQEINEAFCRMVGHADEELLDRDFLNITHPEDRPVWLKRMGQALAGELPYFSIEIRCLHREGREIWCYVSSTLFRDADGTPLYFVSHVQDITDRKKTGELLRETNTALKVLLDYREKDRLEKEKDILTTIEHLVFPFLDKLSASPLDGEQRAYVEILRENLRDISAPFARGMLSLEKKLTPTELQVAELVKRGKTSQEIGRLLHMSDGAVFFHRNNIRQKLGLRHHRTNLRAFLASLE